MNTPDQPNPRAELHRQVRWSLEQWGSEHPDTEADQLIDAYTHSLAEHIRDNLGGDGGFPDGMRHAADLIDPETT